MISFGSREGGYKTKGISRHPRQNRRESSPKNWKQKYELECREYDTRGIITDNQRRQKQVTIGLSSYTISPKWHLNSTRWENVPLDNKIVYIRDIIIVFNFAQSIVIICVMYILVFYY